MSEDEETQQQRLARNLGELLAELRIAQARPNPALRADGIVGHRRSYHMPYHAVRWRRRLQEAQ